VFALNTGYEGLSHLLLEALSLQTPIVTTNVGGNAELIEHNVNGLLVAYNDATQLKQAILTLLRDEMLRETLRRNAGKNLEKFSMPAMIEGLITILRQ